MSVNPRTSTSRAVTPNPPVPTTGSVLSRLGLAALLVGTLLALSRVAEPIYRLSAAVIKPRPTIH